MPISDLGGYPAIMAEVQQLNPQRVLELGIGFGLIGAGCRQILDAQHGRCDILTWKAQIWGVEIFKSYENPLWTIYDGVDIQDFTKELTWPKKAWDLVMMIDSLEHVKPELGRLFLEGLVKYNKHVIVSVPNGRMDQGAVFGNEHERHLWTFTDLEEFKPYNFRVLHRGVCTVVSIKGEAA